MTESETLESLQAKMDERPLARVVLSSPPYWGIRVPAFVTTHGYFFSQGMDMHFVAGWVVDHGWAVEWLESSS